MNEKILRFLQGRCAFSCGEIPAGQVQEGTEPLPAINEIAGSPCIIIPGTGTGRAIHPLREFREVLEVVGCEGDQVCISGTSGIVFHDNAVSSNRSSIGAEWPCRSNVRILHRHRRKYAEKVRPCDNSHNYQPKRYNPKSGLSQVHTGDSGPGNNKFSRRGFRSSFLNGGIRTFFCPALTNPQKKG
jgi:hypothetical protein